MHRRVTLRSSIPAIVRSEIDPLRAIPTDDRTEPAIPPTHLGQGVLARQRTDEVVEVRSERLGKIVNLSLVVMDMALFMKKRTPSQKILQELTVTLEELHAGLGKAVHLLQELGEAIGEEEC